MSNGITRGSTVADALALLDQAETALVCVPTSDDGCFIVLSVDWESIDTAPKNYTPIILRDGGVVGEGWYSSHLHSWEFANPGHLMRRNPTHWRPLPKPHTEPT